MHLFEHVHGESRDRGQAMVELKELYAANGLEMPANELPDYLPLFLEFLSTRPLGEARGYLADIVHIVSVLKERLRRRKSVYAEVFCRARGPRRGRSRSGRTWKSCSACRTTIRTTSKPSTACGRRSR